MIAEPPLTSGEIFPELPRVLELDLFRLSAEVVPTFFDGEAPAFLT
jgi:hypothetical protein